MNSRARHFVTGLSSFGSSLLRSLASSSINPSRKEPEMKLWLTPRYSKTAPEEREAISADRNYVRFKDGWTYHGYVEGDFWHRTRAKAVETARRNRAAWLQELTTKAAEVAALPSID